MHAPDSLLVFLIILCWVALACGKYLFATRVLGFICCVTFIVALFPVGEWVLYPLEKRFAANPALPEKVDGIIMLGGGGDQRMASQWGMPEVNAAGDRYIAFFDLARRYPDVKLVFTGGGGSMVWGKFSEADMARALLENQGFDSSRF